jgi:hypothetical protein
MNDREKFILKEAAGTIYFNDSADYLRVLWNIIDILIGDKIDIDYVEAKVIY